MLKKLFKYLSVVSETAKKEGKLIVKDDAVVEIYIIFVVLVYFFYTFVYSPEIFTKLPVAFIDNDQTTVSHKIKRMLNDTESLDIKYDASSLVEARKMFEEGKVNGIVLIPERFTEKLQKSGGNPSLIVYCDASYMLYYDKSLQAVMNAVGQFTGEIQLKETMMSGTPEKEAIASSTPFTIITNPLYNLEEGYAIFIIPLVLIVALQTLQLTGMGVLYGTLRERNTFIPNFAIAREVRFGSFFMTIGRAIPYYIISNLLLLLGIVVVFHIFTIPQRGDLFEVMAFLTPVVLAITFLGMVLMNIFRNREDTIMLCTVFSIPALMMGGVSYPIVAFPLWIKVLGFFFPSTIGVKGFLALSQAGASLGEIKDIYMQMWGICLFYFVLAVWTNRRFLWKETAPLALLESGEAVVPLALPEKLEEIKEEINVNEPILIAQEEEILPTVELETNHDSTHQEIIKSLLHPFSNSVTSYSDHINTIAERLSEKLNFVHVNKLQTPENYIGGPILDTYKFCVSHQSLENAYLNILANAMDVDNASVVLPSFIDIVKSMSPDEVQLLSIFVKNDTVPFVNILQKANKETKAYTVAMETFLCIEKLFTGQLHTKGNMPLYFANFVRMGILTSPEGFCLSNDRYTHIEQCDSFLKIKDDIENQGLIFEIQRRFYKVTPYGRQFIKIAIQNR